MGKKHREKRQKYIELLRQTEKEREAYLEKRNDKKRRRSEDEATADKDKHAFCGQRHAADEDESKQKKRRTEVDPAAKKVNLPSDEGAAVGKKDTKSKKY